MVGGLEVSEERDQVAFQGVSLQSPHDGRPLVTDLTFSVPFGTRVLISGSNEDAKVALFRATAGIWSAGSGKIIRPPFGEIYFLPERPYLPHVTLRELLVRTGHEHEISDERIIADLCALNLEAVLTRAGDLDTPHEWNDMLSLGEQQLIAFARLFLRRPDSPSWKGSATRLARRMWTRCWSCCPAVRSATSPPAGTASVTATTGWKTTTRCWNWTRCWS